MFSNLITKIYAESINVERENHYWGESEQSSVGLAFDPNPSANLASVERKSY